MAGAPDRAIVGRFADDLIAVLGRSIAPGEQIALAVSGGSDSMAMLALAVAALPGQVIAATVDHGLRAESGAEAAMVAGWCADNNVPHATLAPTEPIARANLQANARAARYRLLEHWAVQAGARVLLTAHHADDQAETFLMRAARGSGVSGLAGVRARQAIEVQLGQPVPPRATGVAPMPDVYPVTLVRPLLGWRHAELRALAEALALPFVDDPSNADPHFDRVRFRALLAASPALDAANLARSAAYIAEADEAIRAFERWLWADRRRAPVGVDHPDDQCWLDMECLPRELRRRLARAAIEQVRLVCGITRPDFSPAANIEPLLDALAADKKATQAGVMVVPKGAIWRFSEAPARRSL